MERLHLWASALVAICLYLEVEMSPVNSAGEKVYCGEKLVTTLDIVCGGFFNDMIKRDVFKENSDDEGTQVRYWTFPKDRTRFPFQSKYLAKALIPFRRRRRGIVDECCFKSCTINEMRNYCGI